MGGPKTESPDFAHFLALFFLLGFCMPRRAEVCLWRPPPTILQYNWDFFPFGLCTGALLQVGQSGLLHTMPWGSLQRAWPYFLIRTAWIHGQHRPIGGLQRARALMSPPASLASQNLGVWPAAYTPPRLALGLSPHPLLPQPHLQTMPRMSAFPGCSAVERLL